MFDLARARKPFYRRWWFILPITLLLVGAIVGGVIYWKVKTQYEAEAQQFDYSLLEEMESASLILDRKGASIGRIFTQNREQVTFEELSETLIKAVIAREDSRFYEHKGVDYRGVIRAVYENWKAGSDKQGASTLTQQLARNTFPEQLPPSDRTKARKLREMYVSFEIEKRCNKNKILELYMNRVYFGNGFFGAESAAKGYFGKHAKELTISEASLLAGLLRSPDRLSPWRHYTHCIAERNVVLNNLFQQKKLSREDYDKAFAEEPVLKNKRPIHQDNYAADMVYQQVLKKVGKDRALGDGLRVHTTIDQSLQRKAEEELRTQLSALEHRDGYGHQTFAQYDQIYKAANKMPVGADGKRLEPEYLQGSIVMLDNKTGGIMAIVGGHDFQHSELNRATQVQVPPGTAFTPLVFAAAFEKGFSPGTALQDTVMDNTKVMIGGTTGILGEWGPERMDNHFEGTISARTALVKSKNAATVRLGMVVGTQDVLQFAEDAGIADELAAYPKTFLGGSEVSPMDLTLAYTIFPNGGSRPAKPFIISRIEDKLGNVLYQENPETVRVTEPTTAYEVHDCLKQVLEQDGTAERASTELGLKRYPFGGKTGTAYNFTDLWFVGYSSEVTCSVWLGFDQQPRKAKASIFRGAFSKDFALPVWAEMMKASVVDYKPREIVQPKGLIRVEICRSSGGLACDKCIENGARTTYQEICTEAQAPKDACPVHSGIAPAAVGIVDPKAPPRPLLKEPEGMTAIVLQEKTVVGNDPYLSHQAVDRMRQLANVGNAATSLTTDSTIPTAEPPSGNNTNIPAPKPIVVPPSPTSDVKLDHPEALKFN